MDEDDEYSLHYEFLDQITKADKHSVASLTKNVLQRGNPFNLEQPKRVMNIATDAILEKNKEDFLMNCISLEKDARNEFYESRLTEKNKQLLEAIPKTRKSTKKKSEKKEYHLAKETFYVILTMLAWKISILKFSWAMKSHLHTFILQKEVRFESQISLNWQLNLKVW